MKNYEGLFILKPDQENEEVANSYKKIQDNISKHQGQVQDAQEWGKKKLAYKIKKHGDGIFYLLRFTMDPAQLKPLTQDYKLDESILRVAITAA